MLSIEFNHHLAQIKLGHKSGIEEIFKAYYKKMTFAAMAIVRDIEIAKDIASDFIKYILENIDKIGYIKNPSAWIYKCIKNMAINFVRKDTREVSIAYIEEAALTREDSHDMFLTLYHEIQVLTSREKEVFILSFLYGFKYREISQLINIPIGTIKSDVSIIKRKLNHLKK